MRGRDELMERLAQRRRQKLGPLSQSAFEELRLAVRANPDDFLEAPADEAFLLLVKALERHDATARDEEFLDEEAFYASRAKRRARLATACEQALQLDPDCLDAALCQVLLRDQDPDALLASLAQLDRDAGEKDGELAAPTDGDAWADVWCRGRLRVRAAIARAYMDSARYRLAQAACEDLLRLSPFDALGARHTCALVLARLEDEAGFDALDARFARHGDAWTHLGRGILLNKLGRVSAAQRALLGFSRLCEGGAFALLRPIMIDTYLPDRPEAKPFSFQEATLAVHEADPIIVDVPDLPYWAEGIPQVAAAGRAYAESHGFDW